MIAIFYTIFFLSISKLYAQECPPISVIEFPGTLANVTTNEIVYTVNETSSCYDGFHISCTNDLTGEFSEFYTNLTTISINNLYPCVNYSINASVVDINNNSGPVSQKYVTTKLQFDTGSVRNFTKVGSSPNNTLLYTWIEPELPYCIDEYLLQITAAAVSGVTGYKFWTQEMNFSFPSQLYQMQTQNTTCLLYEVLIAPWVHPTGASGSPVFDSYYGAPDVIRNLLTNSTNNSINLSWEAPQDPLPEFAQPCTIEYKVSWNEKSVYVNATNYIIDNLESCVEYGVNLYAVNSEGLQSPPISVDVVTTC